MNRALGPAPPRLSPQHVFQWLGLALLLTLFGCATSNEVQNLDVENQAQNARLAAIEIRNEERISSMSEELVTLQQQLRSAQGQLLNINNKLLRITKEQLALNENQERLIAKNHRILRRFEAAQKENLELRHQQIRELDTMRLALEDVKGLFKTGIAGLPDKTKADRHFRAAFLHMINGELDQAADRFGAFIKQFPQDSRIPEARYRRGQVYFLLRRYDQAIVPFFEMVDKHGEHKLAVDGRWMLARSLEETGELQLARQFYAQLITNETVHKGDATRRLFFIDKLFPKAGRKHSEGRSTTNQNAVAPPPAEENGNTRRGAAAK